MTVHKLPSDIWQEQDDVVLNQANPASGTEYTVLDTTKNVRLMEISIKCTWTAQPTPLELRVYIDGQTYVFTKTDPASNTYYYPYDNITVAKNGHLLGVAETDLTYKAFWKEGRSVKVTAEITGGTVSNLACRVRYAQRGG